MDKAALKTALIKSGLVLIGLGAGKQIAILIKRFFPNFKIAV